jgi:PAS domain S-box-containing protein
MSTRLFDSTIVGTTEQALDFIGNILESSTEYSIIGKDLDGKILLWNEGARRLYGYEPEEVVGTANPDILHTPEDVQAGKPREILAAALRDGKWEGTITRPRKNGERFTARVVITPRRDATGKPVGYVLISNDITEQKRAEESLIRSSDFYLTLLDKFPALIWRAGVDAKCNYFNQTWLDFTGRSMDQEMGDGWTEGVHPEDLAGCRQNYLGAFHSRQPFFREYRLRRCDGEYRWIIDQGSAFYDPYDKFAGYMGSCFDITERKTAEVALLESDQRFAAIMENMPGFAWIKDAKGQFVYLNRSYAQLASHSRDWRGKTDRDFWPAEMAAEYQAGDRKVLASGEALHSVEPYQRLDGAIGYLVVNKFPIFDTTGATILVGGIGVDITERKSAEEQLEKSKEQLHALAGRLQKVREEESERISREIHDELGQSLTGLNMDLNWIQQKLEEAKSPLLRSQLKRRMKTMTALLETTVRSVQRISTELRPGMLDDLGLTATLEWQAEEFEARTGIRCRWRPKPAATQVNRDQATALFRIFQEILTNVGRHAHARSVNLKLVQNHGELILEVSDDGRGFSEEKLLDHKSLGLLGMRERAAFMGGRVEIRSTPRKGTKVTVTSPVVESRKRRPLKTGGSNG